MATAMAMLACGGGSGNGHIEISGKSPTEAAALVARTVCTQQAKCGSVTIACSGSGSAGANGSDASAGTSTCTATIEPISYNDCYAKASADIAKLIACAALTPDQTNTLVLCFDTLATLACVTQAEADAQALAAETGADHPSDVPPAACALLVNPPPGC